MKVTVSVPLKMVSYDLVGSFDDLKSVAWYLAGIKDHLFFSMGDITQFRDKSKLRIICPEATSESMMCLLNDFISEK